MKYLRPTMIGAGALLLFLLGLKIGGNFLEPKRQTAGAAGDNVPALGTPGGVIPGTPADSESRATGAFKRVAGTPAPPLTAHAALIADPESGEIIFNFNSGMRWPIASLTKLMTAHVILSEMDLSKIYELRPEDFADGGNSLTRELQPGFRYLGRDLLRVMLVSSSNEAAEAFARVYGRDNFIAAMNKTAADWGLADTHFADPSGIAAGNQSTAKDMETLAFRVWKLHPEISENTRKISVAVYEMRLGRQVFNNTNDFAGRADFLGGKTGTTPEAGENLLSLFSYRTHPVMILLFGSENRFAETESLLNWFKHDFIPGN